jgi:hypothetical protein
MLAPEDLRSSAPLTEVNRLLQLNGWRWPVQGAAGRMAYRRARLFMPAAPAAQSLVVEFGVPAVDSTFEATLSLTLNGQQLYQATVNRGQYYQWSVPVSSIRQASAVMLELITEPDAPGAGYVTANKHLCIQRMEFSPSPPTGTKTTQLMHCSLLPVVLQHLPKSNVVALVLGGRVEQGLEAVGLLRQHGCAMQCLVSEAHWPSYSWLKLERITALSQGSLTVFSGMTQEEAKRQSQQQLPQAWWLHRGVLYDLNQTDPFAEQLSPALNSAEADLRKQLEKQKQKLQASQEKQAALRARLEKTKAESSKKKKWWQRLG